MNVMSVLKAEISRLAKKEARSIVAPVKKASATYRGLIAGLRKQVDALQKELAILKKAVPAPEKALAAKTEPEGRFWITGKGVRKLRQRLGLTQANFGKLIGVSVPTVVNWEGVDGKVEIRKKATMARLQQIKGMGKKQVAEILGLGDAKEPKKAKAPKKANKAKGPKVPKAPKAPKKAKAVKAPKKAKKAKAPKVSKKAKAPKNVKAPKAPKAVEKVEEKPVETPAEVKKD